MLKYFKDKNLGRLKLKGKKFTFIFCIGLILVLVASILLSACAPAAPTPGAPTRITPQVPGQKQQAPVTVTPTVPKAAKPAPAPAPAAEVFKWRYADIYARDSSFSLSTEAFCRNVETMSSGRIEVTYFATGELMASAEIFDGITKGMVQAGPLGMGYAVGVVGKVQNLDAGGAAYLSPFRAYGMLYDGTNEPTEILKTMQGYYSDVGVWPIPSFFTGAGDFVYSTIKLEKSSDLIGLPYRTSGMTSEIMTALGAATVWLPWEELYTALQMGTVKAAEWGGPDLMMGMGLQEVAKYWYQPGIWEGYTESRLINLDTWNELSPDLQKIVEEASKALWLQTQADIDKLDGPALIKVQEEYGVEVNYWTEEDLALFQNAWKDVMETIGTSGDPHTAEMYNLIKDYRVALGEWPE